MSRRTKLVARLACRRPPVVWLWPNREHVRRRLRDHEGACVAAILLHDRPQRDLSVGAWWARAAELRRGRAIVVAESTLPEGAELTPVVVAMLQDAAPKNAPGGA